MKIVINSNYGGFSISKEAAEYMANLGCPIAKAELDEYNNSPEKGRAWFGYGFVVVDGTDIAGYDRTSPYLIEAIEKLGEKANGEYASLKIIEIPDGINYYIDEYGGMESVHEQHRSWY